MFSTIISEVKKELSCLTFHVVESQRERVFSIGRFNSKKGHELIVLIKDMNHDSGLVKYLRNALKT